MTAAEATPVASGRSLDSDLARRQVVYLFGAGASHACVKAVGSPHGILMSNLAQPLGARVHSLLETEYEGNPALEDLVNTVIDDETDFEHIITFLDKSASGLHRRFAQDLRRIFHEVLRDKLRRIESEVGKPPVGLYDALLDMYEVAELGEELKGILTINYDEYIEAAIARAGRDVDFGVEVVSSRGSSDADTLLKLHGSFGWSYTWPIASAPADNPDPLWIPPGIQKLKDEYPFNVLWGLARELLDCDVLRVVGCRLGPNDWDLISLLFTTRHTNVRRSRPYSVEIINSPVNAAELEAQYPYLDVRSVLEVEPAGERIVGELVKGPPTPWASLSPEDQERLLEGLPEENWFRLWLQHTAEGLYERTGSIATPRGEFQRLMEAR